MKKIITLILCAVMLVSVFVFDTSAAGTLIHSDDFNTGFAPRNWITSSDSCAFEWDKSAGNIYGYSDAVVLQPEYKSPYNKKWDDFYASIDVQIKADDDKENQEITYVKLWYRDLFENDENSQGAVYVFSICIQTGEATLTKEHSYSYKDENGIVQENKINNAIATPTNINDKIEVGENAKWFNIGMRVTDGVMQCYYNENLIFDLKVSDDDEKVGGVALNSIDATVGTQKSPVLFWNDGNWVALDNFKVYTADYDFVDVIYGDADGNGAVNLLDASAMMKFAAGWSDVAISEAAADVDGSGKVNLVDVGLVMKAIAKWDVVLGPQA